MYKQLFQIIVSLGVSPIPSWKKLAENDTSDSAVFLNKFIYPLLGLTTLANFVGILWNRKGFPIESALKSASVTLVSLFAGFFLAAYLLNKILVRYFGKSDNLSHTQYFVGYIASFGYVIQIILSLLPTLFFVRFALLYVIYVIWVGSESFMQIEEKMRIRFMVITSIILFVAPVIIQELMLKLMPRLS